MRKKFAVVDLETTGGLVKRDKIIEVGIVLMDHDQIIDQYESLIHPERSISYNITRITGIRDEMVEEAPKFYEVAKDIVEWTEGRIFVAQNVRFDYGFLRREFEMLGYTYTRKQLCTARLSRTLLPQLKRHNLDALTQYFGIQIEHRHRALGDAYATAQVLSELLKLEASQDKILHYVNLGVKETRLPKKITLERLHALPEQCGVYYLHNQFGDVIYVGKSINIKKRVCEHFANFTKKAANLQQFVDDISFEITGSELIALLHEAKEIKKLQPEFNKALRRKPKNHVIEFYEREDGFLSIQVQKYQNENPLLTRAFQSKQQANQYVKMLANQFELCYKIMGLEKGDGPCFLHGMGKCFGACIGEENVDDYNERVELARIAVEKQFNEDFIIVDEGRNAREQSVILIKDGLLSGYGYLEEDQNIEDLDDLESIIEGYPVTPECFGMIYHYIKKKKNIKIIPLREFVN